MKRRDKIIVSVTGIFLVLFILMGFTFAYYLVQINGNTNSKSISVTTSNLKLTYAGNNSEILNNSNVKIEPVLTKDDSTVLGQKRFSIINNGDLTEYVIMIENVKVTDLSNNKITTFNTNDFVYDLTCTDLMDGSKQIVNEINKTMPLSDGKISNTISIPAGHFHECTFKLWYLDNGNDQSSDMNKSLQARINIEDPYVLNPYSKNTNSLAYNIINNAVGLVNEGIRNGEAAYRKETLTVPGVESALGESSLSISEDDYTSTTGIPSYYFRGNVTNNYVDFNGMCWRIVRIEGDGSVKLILEDKDSPCATSDGNWDIGNGYFHEAFEGQGSAHYDTSTIKTTMDTWYNANFSSVDSKVKTDTVCLGDYDSTIKNSPYQNSYRIVEDKNPTFKCNTDLSMIQATPSKISPLTVDEAALSGLVFDVGGGAAGEYSYLINDIGKDWWLLTPSSHFDGLIVRLGCGPSECVFIVGPIVGEVGVEIVSNSYRPTITLKSGVELTSFPATGEKINSYKV